MNKYVKIPLMAIGGAGSVFAVLFTIYFFNLDMKFMATFIEPFLSKHYDKMPRNQYV